MTLNNTILMKKTRLKIVDRILDVINGSHTIAVCSHMRPDGDCIGSSLGLTLALLNLGKEVTCWNQDSIPSKLQFLDRNQIIQTPRQIKRPFDCVIAVDSASIERLGKVQEHIVNRKKLINIDHHTSNTRFGDINWIASREPSSGELIYRLIKEAGWKITSNIADCLSQLYRQIQVLFNIQLRYRQPIILLENWLKKEQIWKKFATKFTNRIPSRELSCFKKFTIILNLLRKIK